MHLEPPPCRHDIFTGPPGPFTFFTAFLFSTINFHWVLISWNAIADFPLSSSMSASLALAGPIAGGVL